MVYFLYRDIIMIKYSLLFLFSLFLLGCGLDSTPSVKKISRNVPPRVAMAQDILGNPQKYKLANYHLSGVRDSATALQNMQDAASGRMSARSSYSVAPGGYCYLQEDMLKGMISLANQGYTIAISEVAGGGHSRTSRHYLGVAYDVTHINGIKVSYSNPYYRAYMAKARALGATEVLGPGDRNHSGHLHIAWPRTDR